MLFFLHSLLALSRLFSFSSAAPNPRTPLPLYQQVTRSPSTPLPPSKDPFYTAPAKFEQAAPGTILRIRHAPGNLTTATGNCSSAYNILYRTTDTRYQPSWAVTTLFIPVYQSPPYTSRNTSHHLLSYQIPYNSVDIDASPSYALYSEIPTFPDIPTALGLGWFVNVPDFEGPLASFAAGVQEGHAVLDSVRAVLSAGLGVSHGSRYAMWGYSGGSIASEWAAELQVQYAPELNFAGIAIGGLVPNVTSALSAASGGLFAGLFPAGLLGITRQYPEVYGYVISKLKTTGPYNKTTLLSVKNMDFNEEFAFFQNQDIFQYFIDGESDLQTPILQKVFDNDGYMGYHGVPQMPMFVYKAIADEISVVGDTDKLVDRYCGVGANILYQRNEVGGHLAEYTNGVERVFEWLGSVLDGTYVEKYESVGCTVQNVSVGSDLSLE